MSKITPSYTAIISRHLGNRALQFVQSRDAESLAYAQNCMLHGKPGFFRRDAVAFRLVRLAFHRYEKATA